MAGAPSVHTRTVTTGRLAPMQKFVPPLEKSVGHSWKLLDIFLKSWAPLRKLFATPGVPSWLRVWYILHTDFAILNHASKKILTTLLSHQPPLWLFLMTSRTQKFLFDLTYLNITNKCHKFRNRWNIAGFIQLNRKETKRCILYLKNHLFLYVFCRSPKSFIVQCYWTTRCQ